MQFLLPLLLCFVNRIQSRTNRQGQEVRNDIDRLLAEISRGDDDDATTAAPAAPQTNRPRTPQPDDAMDVDPTGPAKKSGAAEAAATPKVATPAKDASRNRSQQKPKRAGMSLPLFSIQYYWFALVLTSSVVCSCCGESLE
jgi:hypothetical protein